MKHRYKIGLLTCLLFITYRVQAAPVDSLTLARIAATYLFQHTGRYEGIDFAARRTDSDGKALYYVFNRRNDAGFVILTADDACLPVLGYATSGNFLAENMPPQLVKLLFSRAAEIGYIRREKLAASPEISQLWRQLRNPAPAARLAGEQAVAPLLTTRWNQAPYYNDFCPANAKGQRVVTGCVATAMAQLMKFHNYPRTGQGYRSYTSQNYGVLTANFGNTIYDWASMPTQITSRNTAIATLMYHCGVSVDMGYGLINEKGSSSSGASVQNAANALKNYFSYAATTRLVSRASYASDAAWLNLLKSELDARRPVEYHGFGSEGGHSFVCDGYDNSNLFHFNWGWGGYYDGYFSVNNLNPGSGGIGSGDGNFNSNQGAIIGIQPPSTATSTYNLQLTKRLVVNPNPLTFGDDVSVSFNLINDGKASFKGDYCVALFAADGTFIDFLGGIRSTNELAAGYTYTSDWVFTQKNLFVSEGTYQIEAFYREPSKEWKSMGSTRFANNLSVQAKGVNNDLKMFGTPLQVSASPIGQNTPFMVNCNLKNFGSKTFEGDISMDLQALNGDVVARLEIKQGVVLPANSTFTTALTFRTAGLNVPTGTYFISPGYKPKNESTYYYPSAYKDSFGTYPNLIRVNVVAPALIADRFEPNNVEGQSATLPLTFVNNVATVTSENTNLHLDTDLDYYRLDLPTGYSYDITARVHDSDNSGNGKAYTADVVFSYRAGSSTYSGVYDVSVNDINDKIRLQNGNTVFFKVGPYFAGETGTYLLDLQIARTPLAYLTTTAPRNGDKWFTTLPQQITWTDNIDENVKIELVRGTANTVVQTIAASVPSNGLYTWTPPDGLTEGDDYRVRVSSTTTGTLQSLSGQFSIARLILATEDPTVLISPNPTPGLLTVQTTARAPFHTVLVRNLTGQSVLEKANPSSTNRLSIDLSGQSAGYYIISLIGESGVTHHKISLIR